MRQSTTLLQLQTFTDMSVLVCSRDDHLPSNRVATRPWLAFQAKAMAKTLSVLVHSFLLSDGANSGFTLSITRTRESNASMRCPRVLKLSSASQRLENLSFGVPVLAPFEH